jgi:hypothetical protein
VQPGNFSKLGCLTERMATGGGPTRRLLGGRGGESGHKDYYDLLSPVRYTLRCGVAVCGATAWLDDARGCMLETGAATALHHGCARQRAF